MLSSPLDPLLFVLTVSKCSLVCFLENRSPARFKMWSIEKSLVPVWNPFVAILKLICLTSNIWMVLRLCQQLNHITLVQSFLREDHSMMESLMRKNGCVQRSLDYCQAKPTTWMPASGFFSFKQQFNSYLWCFVNILSDYPVHPLCLSFLAFVPSLFVCSSPFSDGLFPNIRRLMYQFHLLTQTIKEFLVSEVFSLNLLRDVERTLWWN